MKRRTGFVSNSSSASFIIGIDKLDDDQFEKIVNHIEYANDNNLFDENWYPFEERDAWEITVNTKASTISGYTSMNNFPMREFLINIGVEPNDIRYEYNG